MVPAWRSSVPKILQGTSKSKSQHEGLFRVVAGTTPSQEDGHYTKSAALPTQGPGLPVSNSPHFFPGHSSFSLPPHRDSIPSSILHQAFQTLSACLICWTSQLLPITEYKLIQLSKEAAENTGGSRGHHCTSKHQLLCVGSLYTTCEGTPPLGKP